MDQLKHLIDEEIKGFNQKRALTPCMVETLYYLLKVDHELDEYAEDECVFDMETAKKWVHGMIYEDGTRAPKWTMEQATKMAESNNVDFTHITNYDWWAILNSVYSDYAPTAKKYGITNENFYADLAKDWLFDPDAIEPAHKVKKYYWYIVKK